MAAEKNQEEKKNRAAKEDAPQSERKVTIRLPRSKDGQGDVFVSVNERTWLIKRGVPVAVPESVAEVIMTSERAEEEAESYDLAARR